MTSNLGSHIIQEYMGRVTEVNINEIMGELRVQLSDLLRKTIRPEFLNRIDDVVLFKPLSKKELRQIVNIQINTVVEMLAAKEITIIVPDEVKDWLADIGYDSTYGARPLKRTIQRYLINPLSQALLMEKFSKGDTIRVEIGEKGMLVFSMAAD